MASLIQQYTDGLISDLCITIVISRYTYIYCIYNAYLFPNKQSQDRPDSKFHLLTKLYDKSVTLEAPLLFLNAIDIGTLHLLHQRHLLFVLLVPKTPNLHTVSM